MNPSSFRADLEALQGRRIARRAGAADLRRARRRHDRSGELTVERDANELIPTLPSKASGVERASRPTQKDSFSLNELSLSWNFDIGPANRRQRTSQVLPSIDVDAS